MPHVSLRGGKPIHERSGRELIVAFVIVPIGLAFILLGFVGWNLAQFWPDYTWRDWLGVAWTAVVSLVLCVGLPATARREWERRKRFGHSESAPPAER